ncbi:MAG: PAAR domain-containing protein [Polyangiaceae bacterium]|nr:PAAR domain-containing protein [Polyangiaceae bacterium]
MPPAARITDKHACPIPGHAVNAIVQGEETVIVGYKFQSRVGDMEACGAAILRGEPTVIIGNRDAARKGDPTVHGGRIITGCPTVLIGSNPQAETLKTDKPFCEDCERKKKEREEQRKRGRT